MTCQGGQQTLEDPEKPLDFLFPWKNTLENPEITTYPWKIMLWSRFSAHQFLVLQCCCIFCSSNAEEEDLWGYWGENSVSFVVWQQPHSNNGHKLSSKIQNERWMGTGRRSIRENHIFPRKHSQKYPWKP